MSKVVNAFALGILILAVAVFVPTLIDATQEDKADRIEIRENQTVSVTDRLSVTADDIQQTEVMVVVENTDTLNSSTQTINETETAVYTVDGDEVTVTVDSITSDTSGEYARLSVQYDPLFGADSGTRTFINNWPVLLAAIGFLIVVALVFKGVDP